MPTPRLSLLVLLCLGVAHAATPRDEVLRYVPDDVGFCAVLTGVPAAVERLRESPFAALLAKAAAKGAPGVKEWDELQKVADQLRDTLKVDLKELLGVVPGEAFVFAYRPGPPGKTDQEQALYLLRSRDAKALARLIGTLNVIQGAKVATAAHEGVTYYRRDQEGAPRGYYLLSGPVLLFSTHEEMLKRAIDHERVLKKDAIPVMARRLADLGLEKAEIAVVLNPRAFDAHMTGTAKEARTVAAYWKALAAAGLGLSLGRDAGLSLSLLGDPAKLPPAGRKLLEGVAKSSSLWGSFPEKPLLAVAGRVDLPGLYAALCEFMPEAGRESLEKELARLIGSFAGGKDVIKELLPALGPDWGFCLLAPPAGAKEALPRLLAAVRLASGDETAEAVGGVMQAWAHAALLGLTDPKKNPDNVAHVATRGKGKEAVRYIESKKGLPPSVRPAWSLRAGHVLFGSTPDEVSAFKPGEPPAGGVPLARASASAWRDFVKGNRGALAEAVAAKDGIKKAEAEARLDAVDSFLSLLDAVELTRTDGPSRVTFTLRVRFAAALRKE